MKKMILFCIVMLFMASSSWAQDPIDIKGWNNTLWGMTEDNIRQLFEGQITVIKKQEIDDGKLYRNLSLNKYNIAGVDFDVLFEMGTADNRLRSVRLVCIPALNSYFGRFEQLLTGKYGPPKSKDGSQSGKTASWFLPSTKIELIFSHMYGFGNILNILYSDQSILKKDFDKL